MTNYGVYDQNGDVTQVPAEGDNNYVANSAPSNTDDAETVAPSDVVGGPEVVSASSVERNDDEAAPGFDGTSSADDRAAADADAAEAADKRTEDSKDVAAAQALADQTFRNENPDSPVARAANPDVGGERF